MEIRPPSFLDEFFRDPEADAGANVVFGREEGVEDAAELGFGDAGREAPDCRNESDAAKINRDRNYPEWSVVKRRLCSSANRFMQPGLQLCGTYDAVRRAQGRVAILP
jgi:hypothetical protein